MNGKRILRIALAFLCIAMTLTASAATKKPVESVTLDGPAEIYTGTSKKITPAFVPKDASDRRLKWSSSDTSVASVNSDGTVRGRKTGTAVITAETRDGSGKTAQFKVHIIDKVTGVKLEKSSVKLLADTPGADTVRVACTVTPATAYYDGVTWSSSNESIVTVDEDGNIHAVAGGKATVTATTQDPGSKSRATLTVTVGQPVGSIVITNPPSVLNVGSSVRISAEALPRTASDRGIVYSTTDANVLTVDKNGTLRAKGTGTASLVCTAQDGSGVTEEVEITVVRMVTGISAKKSASALIKGSKKQFSVTVKPEDATDPTIRWSSSNASVAEVDGSGFVSAIEVGTCTIYGKTVDGSGKEIKFSLAVEPTLPVRLSGFGRGIDSAGILVMRFSNLCKKFTIKKIDFDCTFLDAWGNELGKASGESEVTIAAGEKATATEAVWAPDETVRYAITLTGVTFSDGSSYLIPESERITDIWA